MSKTGGALNTAGKVIMYIMIVLLIIGVAGGVTYFFLRSRGVTFYVTNEGHKYYSGMDGASIWLSPGETHSFSVRSLTGGEVNYSVKVLANEANNFGFFADQEFHRFYDNDEQNDDYSEIFGLKKSINGFTLTIPEEMTVRRAIEEKFGENLQLQTELQEGLCYFVLVVTAGGSSVTLWFNIDELQITIDPPSVVF